MHYVRVNINKTSVHCLRVILRIIKQQYNVNMIVKIMFLEFVMCLLICLFFWTFLSRYLSLRKEALPFCYMLIMFIRLNLIGYNFQSWYNDELLLRNGWSMKGVYALFPAGTIVRDSYHPKSPTHLNQGLKLRSIWVQILLNEILQ